MEVLHGHKNVSTDVHYHIANVGCIAENLQLLKDRLNISVKRNVQRLQVVSRIRIHGNAVNVILVVLGYIEE